MAKGGKGSKRAAKSAKPKSKAKPARKPPEPARFGRWKLREDPDEYLRKLVDRKQYELTRALETAQLEAIKIGVPCVLKVAFPPRGHASQWSAPWAIVGRFVFRPPILHQDLYRVLWEWSRPSSPSMRRIGNQRRARFRMSYLDSAVKHENPKYRGRGEVTLSEGIAYEAALERARSKVDPSDDHNIDRAGNVGSFASRYGTGREDGAAPSVIESLFVWLAEGATKNLML